MNLMTAELQQSWLVLESYLDTLAFTPGTMPQNGVLELESGNGKSLVFEVMPRGILVSVSCEVPGYQFEELLEPALLSCHYKEFLPLQVSAGLASGDRLVFSSLLPVADASPEQLDPVVSSLLSMHDKLSLS